MCASLDCDSSALASAASVEQIPPAPARRSSHCLSSHCAPLDRRTNTTTTSASSTFTPSLHRTSPRRAPFPPARAQRSQRLHCRPPHGSSLPASVLRFRPQALYEATRMNAALYIACGIDPAKSTVFVQSHVTARSSARRPFSRPTRSMRCLRPPGPAGRGAASERAKEHDRRRRTCAFRGLCRRTASSPGCSTARRPSAGSIA